jgi:tagaturonate reductase
MNDAVYGKFTKELMHTEIAPAIPFALIKKLKKILRTGYLNGFVILFIEHQWQSITVQYTSKMKMRIYLCCKTILNYNDTVPAHMAAVLRVFCFI